VRVFYLDPGLRNELGHHANWCRAIAGELRRRGIETKVYAFAEVVPALRAELEAIGHFRYFPYRHFDPDPICGWLTAFQTAAVTTAQDLARLEVAADDLVYVNSAQPGPLFGVTQWLASRPADRRPLVIVEFAFEPGLSAQRDKGEFIFSVRDARQDPRATLFRFTALQIPPALSPHLRFVTFDEACSAVYRMLLQRDVLALPMPHRAVTSCRDRTGQRPITIALLGHQRPDKGYELVPEIVRTLLAARQDVRFLIHNAAPGAMAATQQALRQNAAASGRIEIEERVAGPALLRELLERADLVLCPYLPERYIASHSSVAAEALANAIPLVVPADTALAKQLRDFGEPGTSFERFEPAAIADATLRLLAEYDRYAGRAVEAAALWAGRHGPQHLVDGLLALGRPGSER